MNPLEVPGKPPNVRPSPLGSGIKGLDEDIQIQRRGCNKSDPSSSSGVGKSGSYEALSSGV